MSAVNETATATRRHGFAEAIGARDHAALVETLAEEVVLHSAVTAAPFEGKETVSELYASVIESFEHVEVVDDFGNEDTYAFSGVVGSTVASSRGPTGCASTLRARFARSPSWPARSRASRPF